MGGLAIYDCIAQEQCLELNYTRYWQQVTEPKQMCNLRVFPEVKGKSGSNVLDALKGFMCW